MWHRAKTPREEESQSGGVIVHVVVVVVVAVVVCSGSDSACRDTVMTMGTNDRHLQELSKMYRELGT